METRCRLESLRPCFSSVSDPELCGVPIWLWSYRRVIPWSLKTGTSSGSSLCAVPRRSRGVPSLLPLSPPRLSLDLVGHSFFSAADSAQAEELSLSGCDAGRPRHTMHYVHRADRGVPFRIWTLQPILSNRPLRRGWIQRVKARLRHRVWRITLVDTLFRILDSHSFGALGSHELGQFAALTGSPSDVASLQVQISHLLDTWGSTLGSRFSTNKTSLWYFRQVVSPDGPLYVTKKLSSEGSYGT